MIDIASLIAAGIPVTQAKAFAEPLFLACTQFFIDSNVRQAAFVAQCAHESAMFTRLEENLWYRKPERICEMFHNVKTLAQAQSLVGKPKELANIAYANRLGNGDEASGDGYKFRGRGLIQCTGRMNYTRCSNDTGFDFVMSPDLMLLPHGAALSAAWFWWSNGCNALADISHTDDLTRKINGPAMAGAAERRQLFADTIAVFNSQRKPA